MKMTVEVNVTDCRDCLFSGDYRGHGECWTECRHPDYTGDCYGNILWGCGESFKKVPTWCPLGLGETNK